MTVANAATKDALVVGVADDGLGWLRGSGMIELERLTKRYGAFTAVDDLSLQVARGEIFGFLGPNGAGKTTTIRCLLDLIRPTSGAVRVLGLDPQAEPLVV